MTRTKSNRIHKLIACYLMPLLLHVTTVSVSFPHLLEFLYHKKDFFDRHRESFPAILYFYQSDGIMGELGLKILA